ncbi:hypothetical protein F1737_06895 [Methanoplanus sp. FWC-SCC4]|uniref:Uncharacterized protein n=2 Tax=Methanochimaera problematica TaxID=2609417 RepID=A0AA97FCC1_9EURY|nr:hypothetical protein F1737_06895 [Methanoplanus sp. FWC-SCC4]
MNAKTPFAVLAICMILILFTAGCTTATESEKELSKITNFEHTVSPPEKHYRADDTCYYESLVDIRNNAQKDEKNVIVRCNLINVKTGEISDTVTQYFEVINAGDHKAFTVKLNGDCDSDYSIEIEISEDKS